MDGLTQDLLNGVARYIVKNWKRKNGDIEFFRKGIERVGLTPAELEEYLDEEGDVCPICVNKVFAAIVYEDFSTKKGGAR